MKVKIPKDISNYGNGYQVGVQSKQHPDQIRQEVWNKMIVFGQQTYDDYKEWESGFYDARNEWEESIKTKI